MSGLLKINSSHLSLHIYIFTSKTVKSSGQEGNIATLATFSEVHTFLSHFVLHLMQWVSVLIRADWRWHTILGITLKQKSKHRICWFSVRPKSNFAKSLTLFISITWFRSFFFIYGLDRQSWNTKRKLWNAWYLCVYRQ